MDITKLRLLNMESIIENKFDGSIAKFADEVGIARSEVSQIKNEANQRNIGPSLARRIEVSSGLDKGWMDTEHHLENLFVSVPIIYSGETTIDDTEALINHSSEHVYIEKKILDAHDVNPVRCIAIKILSDSMAPKLGVGDVALINMEANIKIDSATFAVIDNGLICIRKINLMPNQGLMLTALAGDNFTAIYNDNKSKGVLLIGRIFFYMASWNDRS